MENKKKFKLQLPHVYTLAFILIIGFAILTWILPSGQFDRQLINTAAGEREVAVAGTYHVIDKVSESGDLRQGLHEILMAPTRGIQAAADVVAFVLLIGGTFQILTKTNAMNRGIRKVILRLKGKEVLLIPILMILLGIGGTTFGMSEEVIPFYVMLIPIFFAMGYDSMTTFMIVFLLTTDWICSIYHKPVQRSDRTGCCWNPWQPTASIQIYLVGNYDDCYHRLCYAICNESKEESNRIHHLSG